MPRPPDSQINTHIQLTPAQRKRAIVLSKEIRDTASYDAAAEIIALRDLAALAAELCTAVDREVADIGGSRPSLIILGEMGPMVDQLLCVTNG